MWVHATEHVGGLCCPAASSPLCANLILCLPPVMHSTAFVKHTHAVVPLAPSLSSHHLYINYYSASTPFPLLLLVNGDQVTGAPRSRAQHSTISSPSRHTSPALITPLHPLLSLHALTLVTETVRLARLAPSY